MCTIKVFIGSNDTPLIMWAATNLYGLNYEGVDYAVLTGPNDQRHVIIKWLGDHKYGYIIK